MPKRVGLATYVHRSAIADLKPAQRRRLQAAARRLHKMHRRDWTVARVRPLDVMFAATTSFDTDPHPEMRWSIRVEHGASSTPTTYAADNPPIYHRKEQMLRTTHPRYAQFAALTAAEDQAGLLGRPEIGRRRNWERLLASHRLTIEGHKLVSKRGSRAVVDLDALIAQVEGLTPKQEADALFAELFPQTAARKTAEPVKPRLPPQERRRVFSQIPSQILPGRGPDPMEDWIDLVMAVTGGATPPKELPLNRPRGGYSKVRPKTTEAQRARLMKFVPDLRWYDVILVNTSAGKDSIAMSLLLYRLAKELGITDRLVMVHADLGFVEWAGTAALAAEHADTLGLPIEIVSRQINLLDRILSYGLWPDHGSRYCTGEYKTALVEMLTTRMVEDKTGSSVGNTLDKADVKRRRDSRRTALAQMEAQERRFRPEKRFIGTGTEYAGYVRLRREVAELEATLATGIRPVRFLNALGLRGAESDARKGKPTFYRKTMTNRRVVDTWLPIQDWPHTRVFAAMNNGPLRPPPTYACGMSRHSCVFCIMAAHPDLIRAALLSPDLLARYVALEQTLLDPRINPWDGDVIDVRDQRWTVVERIRPGELAEAGVLPHKITYRAGGERAKTIDLATWRKLVEGATVIELGRKHRTKRSFPPMPMREIKALSDQLRRAGIDPRKDVAKTGLAIKGLLAKRRAARLLERAGSTNDCGAHGSHAQAPLTYPLVVGYYEWPAGTGKEWVWIEEPQPQWFNLVVHADKPGAHPDGQHHDSFMHPAHALRSAIALVQQSDGVLVSRFRGR